MLIVYIDVLFKAQSIYHLEDPNISSEGIFWFIQIKMESLY